MSPLSILYVSDQHLGARGLELVQRYFPTITSIIWSRGDTPGRRVAREVIRSRKWDLVISFYSDLVFHREDLNCMRLPINIHPALPEIPGVGFDMVPLIESHSKFGATIHRITEGIDEGEIVEVIERPLDSSCSYMEFRQRIHSLSLESLEHFLISLGNCGSVEQMESRLEAMRENLVQSRGPQHWSKSYWSYARLQEMVQWFHSTNPDHPVFLDNPLAKGSTDSVLRPPSGTVSPMMNS